MIGAGATLGERELRVGTPNGVSGPRSFWVDVYPNALESESNDDAARAQPIATTPVVLNGAIQTAGDRDMFSFKAKEGETWVADATASRIHSPLAAVLEMAGESGHIVAAGRTAEGGDPRIVYRCERTGRYVLSVRDRDGKGGPDFTYRLALGRLPVVTSVVPHGEKPGRKVALRVKGANLGNVSKAVVSIPADASPGLYWTTVRTTSGPSLPFPLIADFAPVAGLTETDALMPLPTLPCALEGVFAVYPSSRFAFQSGPMDTMVFSLVARSIGGDVEGAIRITETSGKELAASSPAGIDARLEFTPAAEGVYVVEALDRSKKIGPDHYYRLSAHRASPDFRIHLNADRVNLAVSSGTSVTLDVERTSGFDGPIQVTASGLPRGVTMSGKTIPAGAKTAEIRFEASSTTPHSPVVIALSATATVGGIRIVHRVVPHSPLTTGPGYRTCELLPLAVTAESR